MQHCQRSNNYILEEKNENNMEILDEKEEEKYMINDNKSIQNEVIYFTLYTDEEYTDSDESSLNSYSTSEELYTDNDTKYNNFNPHYDETLQDRKCYDNDID